MGGVYFVNFASLLAFAAMTASVFGKDWGFLVWFGGLFLDSLVYWHGLMVTRNEWDREKGGK